MEILVTLGYYFLVRLIFIDYKLIPFNLAWKFVVFGIYGAAVLTEIIALGQFTPYSKVMFVSRPVVKMAPEFGGIVKSVDAKPNASGARIRVNRVILASFTGFAGILAENDILSEVRGWPSPRCIH